TGPPTRRKSTRTGPENRPGGGAGGGGRTPWRGARGDGLSGAGPGGTDSVARGPGGRTQWRGARGRLSVVAAEHRGQDQLGRALRDPVGGTAGPFRAAGAFRVPGAFGAAGAAGAFRAAR